MWCPWLFLVNNNYIDIPLHHLQPFLHGWKYNESKMHSHIMVLRRQILHQCWLCWWSMHVRYCNVIICCYNLCIVSSMLSYEMSMFYDTCGILDLLQSIIISTNPLVKTIIPAAAHFTADWYRSMYVSSVDKLLLHFHPACARLCMAR
jgi:hypothetical protein